MMNMYGKLHEATRKIVDVMTTGRRYLGTYFRIAFFGRVRELCYNTPYVGLILHYCISFLKKKQYGKSYASHAILSHFLSFDNVLFV